MKARKSLLYETFKSYMPLKKYFIENKKPLLVGLFCLLIVDFLQLLIPLVIKRTIDTLTFQTATSHILLKYGLVIIAISLVMAALRYVYRRLLFGHSRMVEEKLRNRLYNHIQKLSPSFYHRTKTGDIMARAINDINGVRMATGMGLVALTDGLVLGLTAVGFMMMIDFRLALISIIPAPIIIYMTRILTRRMSTQYEDVQKIFSNLTERAREAFAGIRVVKAYGRENWEYEKIEQEGKAYIRGNLRLAKTIGLFFPMMAIFTNLGLAIVIWLGGRQTILGQITTGDFVAFISYLNLLTWPLMAIGWVTNLIQRGSASMRRINRVLEEVPEINEPPHPQVVAPIRGEIRLEGVGFEYPGQRGLALSGLDLTIEKGQTISLVGRVGSGKSTLLQMVPRLFDPTEGRVLIDGVDVRLMPVKRLREAIGFVTQEAVIFSDTVRNNVTFGREGISPGEFENALSVAHIQDEVQALENGMHTILGERGITLSGGQRQRLTIARALISDPPILILDDAFSMVDTRTEEGILNRILEMRRGKTTLIVSHRVSTIRRANLIAVLDQGKLVEMGTHDKLLEQRKEYTKLYERQVLAQELEMEH